MECFICTERNPEPIHLGCACRSDSGFAHVDCVAKFRRASPMMGRRCPTCAQNMTGRMLHHLNAYFTGEGELVCHIQALAEQLIAHNIPIVRRPILDQTCLRVPLPNGPHPALSVAACKPCDGTQEHFFRAMLVDANDRVVISSGTTFVTTDMPALLAYIQSNLGRTPGSEPLA